MSAVGGVGQLFASEEEWAGFTEEDILDDVAEVYCLMNCPFCTLSSSSEDINVLS